MSNNKPSIENDMKETLTLIEESNRIIKEIQGYNIKKNTWFSIFDRFLEFFGYDTANLKANRTKDGKYYFIDHDDQLRKECVQAFKNYRSRLKESLKYQQGLLFDDE